MHGYKDSVDALLLASGFSRRFGSGNKLLVPFRGKPLARHILELVSSLNCFDRIFFVAAEEGVISLAQGLPVTVIRNDRAEQGQGESIRRGVAASGAAYYMFFPCDQPLLDADTIFSLLNVRGTGRIVQPAFKGAPGTPAIFSNTFREELLSLAPGEHPRDIKGRHQTAVITVDLASPMPLLDIDDPEMLEKMSRFR
ncbi:MAG: nucleotidyltransferase family protein [Treponema sp.]|jgi:molybdenum cofactor cytidylyltransferase|nr:nucleotidyltransferase family protein [Treponema sp.]